MRQPTIQPRPTSLPHHLAALLIVVAVVAVTGTFLPGPSRAASTHVTSSAGDTTPYRTEILLNTPWPYQPNSLPAEIHVQAEQWPQMPVLPVDDISVPQASDGRWWGIQLYNLSLQAEYPDQIGAGWVRVPLHWKYLEPENTTPENIQWSAEFDALLAQLSSKQIRVIFTLMGNPSWAATYEAGPIDKVPIDELVEFMEAVVAHYGQPPYNIKYFEIYNEPDNYRQSRAEHGGWGYFGRQPEKYVEVLAALYDPIKAVDPEARIVFGGLAYDGWNNGFEEDFLDDVLALDGDLYFDVMNFHYFTYFQNLWDPYGIDIIGKTTYIRDKLADYGVSKPFICTEACEGSNPGFGTLETQSRYVPQLYARSQEADLDLTIWWWLFDFATIEMQCGLLDKNGEPKQAYYAYQTLDRELSSTVYVGPVPPGEAGSDKIEAYEFETVANSSPIIVAWTSDNRNHTMSLKTGQVVVVDKEGDRTVIRDGDDGNADGEVMVPIGPSPVYLRSQEQYELVIATTGEGSVEIEPRRASYEIGYVVTLTPIPAEGWAFDQWGGPDAGDLVYNDDGTWSLTMDADKTLSATFSDHRQFQLSISTTGEGTVERDPTQQIYQSGDVVMLTAIPAPGWVFERWGGPDGDAPVYNGDGTWSLTMDADKALTAIFTLDVWRELVITTAGQGTVNIEPERASYAIGDVVTLTPIPAEGWAFDQWGGPDAGDLVYNDDGTWSLTMDADKTLSATFSDRRQFQLSISTTGEGTVNRDPAQQIYQSGDVVTLTAIPVPGWGFDRWGGPDGDAPVYNGDGTWSLTMNADKVLTAVFDEGVWHDLVITTVGQGTVNIEPEWQSYEHDYAVALTPIPAQGWAFDQWGGPDAGELMYNHGSTWLLVMDADKAVTAIFAEKVRYGSLLPLVIRDARP